MISCKDVEVRIGSRILFTGLNWDFEPAKINAILGPSGVGKTTLLTTIAGLTPLEAGTIDGVPKEGMAWAQQNSPMLTTRSARDNVALGALCRGVEDVRAFEAADQILTELHLADQANTRSGRLSGGERQRVALGRALVQESAVILCDEPTASLDPGSKLLIINALIRAAKHGVSVIVSTHDPEVAERADTVLNLGEFAPPPKVVVA